MLWVTTPMSYIPYTINICKSKMSIRPHKKRFSLSSYPAMKCHAGGPIFFYFLYFFVCPSGSPAATYNFKAIKQSINKTKLLFIDRLGEKAILNPKYKSCLSFYTRRSSS